MYRARYRRIVLFFARIIASVTFWDILLPRLRMGKISARGRSERMRRGAAGFRKLAIQMGGVMIKVGQFLSTRVDILPREVTNELAGLQDEVPAVPFPAIRQVAEAEYGIPLEEKFDEFNPVPLGSASLGQVHRARIYARTHQLGNGLAPKNGFYEVVVKIQRPDIEQIIATDLKALRTVGKWLQRFKPIQRRANIPALLDEFTRILYEEIDYLAEGRNAETFAANFASQPTVRVPKVIWTHTTRRALTLEDVFAIKITDYPAIAAAGVDRNEVASRLLDTYLQQIFEDGFFHADPHPGNLFVEPLLAPPPSTAPQGRFMPFRQEHAPDEQTSKVAWQLTFVDFGMVGHVPANLRSGLRELLIGVGTQDAQRTVQAYQQMGILLPNADLKLLEKANAQVFESFWGRNMTELSNLSTNDLLQFADEFRELIYNMPFQIPQDVIFLVRTVSILSGMCTGLNPQFNVWTYLVPHAQKIMLEEARNNRGAWVDELKLLARAWLSMPNKLDNLINNLERGDISVRSPEISQQVNRLERAVHRITGTILFTALLLGGIQLYLGDEKTLGAILLGFAAISLSWMAFRSLK
jgi:predicted unusual protein kinase regulating ubiquinone biosynthesis (AarF/ABC1/UbiB family)